jgi:hypothetical protein
MRTTSALCCSAAWRPSSLAEWRRRRRRRRSVSTSRCTVVDAERRLAALDRDHDSWAGCSSHGARMACAQARARCDVARALNCAERGDRGARPARRAQRAGARRARATWRWPRRGWRATRSTLSARRSSWRAPTSARSASYNPRARRVASESPLARARAAAPAAALDDSVSSPASQRAARWRRCGARLFGGRRKATTATMRRRRVDVALARSTDGADELARRRRSAV